MAMAGKLEKTNRFGPLVVLTGSDDIAIGQEKLADLRPCLGADSAFAVKHQGHGGR